MTGPGVPSSPEVSIVIPVLNQLGFTQQCLERIWRHTANVAYEVVVVDNGSSDGTREWLTNQTAFARPVIYHRSESNLGYAAANNLGARLSSGKHLLFLNNDTLVQPGWLVEMVEIARDDAEVGIVGIKQLFPYTNLIYHTGVVFAAGGVPQHIYAHLDSSLPLVNHQRRYQAVTGACMLVERQLFDDCGGFDEGYRNGYEDTDLCMAAGRRGRTIICCTRAYIYHYGQITEGRTAHDSENARRFAAKWGDAVRVDQEQFWLRDGFAGATVAADSLPSRTLADDCIYLADDLSAASAFSWVNVALATALDDLGVPVFLGSGAVSTTIEAGARRRLGRMVLKSPPTGGTQIKWSHYWPRHLNIELNGTLNCEFFVINYLFADTTLDPWDYWLQGVRGNRTLKLPVSEFCQSVLNQIGVREPDSFVVHHGYSPEVHDVGPPARPRSRFRFLTVTNSHDLGRYGSIELLKAFDLAFAGNEDVSLVVKDYGAASPDTSLRDAVRTRSSGPSIEYLTDFTTKRELIELYRSCDAFVSAHRGEGFGMKILDAMACGLPVVTPLFGGPTSYATSDNCFVVEHQLMPVGDCVDSRALALTNRATWADPVVTSLAEQMRRVIDRRTDALDAARRAQQDVLDRFSWRQAAARLAEVTRQRQSERARACPTASVTHATSSERSPYWLGLRVSIVIPTRDRREKLLACLDALTHQSVLPSEFEVIVVDDGSTDGTAEAVASRTDPFDVRYVRQDKSGPGTARNRGVEIARGELVLFIGDDVLADRQLLEAHLQAHADRPAPGLAVLGQTDWAAHLQPNAVMDCVCGDAALQFAYSIIPTLASLDHRFFYTSNISLRREFLQDAARGGVRFDPDFVHAAFEDSEFALRLTPRGLLIRYHPEARAFHDHWMDLAEFAAREFRAGQMAVVFYRKHPGEDKHLQVRWIDDLSRPSRQLLEQPALRNQMESFDRQSDDLLRTMAGSLEALLGTDQKQSVAQAPKRVRPALQNVLRAIFDTERTRGKIHEWFATVDDPDRIRAAQTLASVRRKIEFLTNEGSLGVSSSAAGLEESVMATLGEGIKALQPDVGNPVPPASTRALKNALRRVIGHPAILSRLLLADRSVQTRLEKSGRAGWLNSYRRVRGRIRRIAF